jgi:hypothetical protein
MERRYLVATLAIIATFAATSHGFRALQHMSLTRHQQFWSMVRSAAMAKARCEASATTHAMAKLRTHLRPRSPEEAQLLAEINVPLTGAESTIAAQMARQNAEIARCARAQAMQQAARAHREAMRMQQEITRATEQVGVAPTSIELNLPSDLDPRTQAQLQAKLAAMTAQLAANHVKLQIAANKLRDSSMQLETIDIPRVEITGDGGRISTHVHTHVRCNVINDKTGQRQPQ